MPRTKHGNYVYHRDPVADDPKRNAGYWQEWDRMKETTPHLFTVAPGCKVEGDTRTKTEGDEINPAVDFKADPRAANELVREHCLIRLPETEAKKREQWKDFGWMVSLRSSLISSKDSGFGILVPGQPCDAVCFATEAIPEHQAVGAHGVVVTVPAKPASDGTKTLEELVAKGYIVEPPKRLGRKAGK